MIRLPSELVGALRHRCDGRKVCVTGGAGFIGGHLTDALVSLGATVTIIDDLSTSDAAHVGELLELAHGRVRFVHGSILEPDAVAEAIEDAEAVFHLAALASVQRSVEAPERTWTVNTTGTMRVLQAAHEAGSKRVVLAASSSAYGGKGPVPSVESQTPSAASPYAASKLAAEALCESWSDSYGLSTACLRFFNIFGPRQSASSAYAAVVAAFVRAMLAGERPTIYGDGTQTRDFTFVSNAVAALMLAGFRPEPFRGQRINVAAGKSVSVNELCRLVARSCGVADPDPIYRPSRAGDVPRSSADLTAAKTELGYEPIASLEDGLDQTVNWARQLAEAQR